MIIFTDAIYFAAQKLGYKCDFEEININLLEKPILELSKQLFNKENIYKAVISQESYWNYLFIAGKSENSQFDILTDLSSNSDKLPDKILCIASEGKNFHGLKNRPWSTLYGNLHLSVYLKPESALEHFASAFMVLPSVAVIETLDEIASLKNIAMCKWVNDILIDGAKVCGIISSTKIQGNILKSVVLGIGLNIEAKPFIAPNEFVPEVTYLHKHIKRKEEAYFCKIFRSLLKIIQINYEKVLTGKYIELLEFYIKRSAVIDKEVIVVMESTGERIKGKVLNIGKDLELYLDSHHEPIYDGRLILNTSYNNK